VLTQCPQQNQVIKVWPEIAGLFRIQLDFTGSGYLKVINAGGVIVDNIPLSPARRNFNWDPAKYGKGTYIFQVWSDKNKILGTAKGILRN
jgi:hypothetical protein